MREVIISIAVLAMCSIHLGSAEKGPSLRITSFSVDAGGNATLEYEVIGNPFTRVLRADAPDVELENWQRFSTSTRGGSEAGRLQSTFSVRGADARVYRVTYE